MSEVFKKKSEFIVTPRPEDFARFSSWDRAKNQILGARRQSGFKPERKLNREFDTLLLTTYDLVSLEEETEGILHRAHTNAERMGSFAVLPQHVLIAMLEAGHLDRPNREKNIADYQKQIAEITFSAQNALRHTGKKDQPKTLTSNQTPLIHSSVLRAVATADIKAAHQGRSVSPTDLMVSIFRGNPSLAKI